ncbi:uncharacterized protein NEMAJ01_0203 [Nematocida major]|uniref:uncharacterized protein n=1 Tax=Nematocida major TaxID=1912982 RepID=UPI002007DAF5|nr:uncharacterized protein NEMAJ01_0203 [Nematocida major]KAH9385307.1 hypothetical protein NEMAJ01_0203 [Nematocida major]
MNERKFEVTLEKQLELFRTATEWSDLVAYLTGLEGILRANKYSKIPKAHLLYRRLSQCLNPALPAGVHMKALGVYRIFIPKLPKETLAEDVDILLLGLFSFYSHCSITTIPSYLDLLKLIITILGNASAKIAKNLILGVIMGLEEKNTEQFSITMEIIAALNKCVGQDLLIKSVWEVMGHSVELVPGCLAYVESADIGFSSVKSHEDVVTRGFTTALHSKETVVLRKAFDILMAYSNDGYAGLSEIFRFVLKLLLKKEISLVKRVQAAISFLVSGPEGFEKIIASLEEIFHESPQVYFKVLMALRQNVQEAPEILKRSLVFILSNLTESSLEGAKQFLQVVDKRIFWTLFVENFNRNLVNSGIAHGLVDETSRTVELPAILLQALKRGMLPYEWNEFVSFNESVYLEVCAILGEKRGDIEALQVFLYFLSLPVEEHLADLRKGGICVILERIESIWEGNPPEEVHERIVSVLERVQAPIGLSEAAFQKAFSSAKAHFRVFWKYDRLFQGRLQEMLLQDIVYVQGKVRKGVDNSKELGEALDLVNSNGKSEISGHFSAFLISFCNSNSFVIRKKARTFCKKNLPHLKILKTVFEHLNNPLERDFQRKGTCLLVDCDYNRVLFGLQTLKGVLLHSEGAFSRLLSPEINLEKSLQRETESIFDLVDFYFEAKPSGKDSPGRDSAPGENSTRVLTCLAVLLFVYSTGTYSWADPENQMKSHESEIISRSIELLKKVLVKVSQKGKLVPKRTFITAILKNAGTEKSFQDALDIVPAHTAEEHHTTLSDIYESSPEMRKVLLRYAISSRGKALLFILLQKMASISEKCSEELQNIEYVLQETLGVPAEGAPGRTKESILTDQETFAFLVFLVSLIACNEKAAQTLQKHGIYVHEKYPNHLVEAILHVYTLSGSIKAVDFIPPEAQEPVFAAVLRLSPPDISPQYRLLRAWTNYLAPARAFEGSHVFDGISAVISQLKIRQKNTEILRFLADFVQTLQSRDVFATFVQKIFESYVFFSVKLGLRKIEEKPEKRPELLELLETLESFISETLRRGITLDLHGIWTTLLFPCYKLPNRDPIPEKALKITKDFADIAENKQWRKDFYEHLQSDRFFKDSPENLQVKLDILAKVPDTEKLADFLARSNSTGFFMRDDIQIRAALIKRVRCMVQAGPFSEYVESSPGLFALISEMFSVVNLSKPLLSELFGLCSALSVKMPANTLVNMWPISVSEAVGALSAEPAGANLAAAFSAIKFLNVVSSLDFPEVIEFRWYVENLTPPASSPPSPAEKRTPFPVENCELSESVLSHAITSVSRHHQAQKHATESCRESLFELLKNDLLEPEESPVKVQ